MDFQVGRFEWQSDDADIHRTVFDALQDFVAEIAVDADVNLGVLALKFGKNIRKEIEAGSFVGAENDRTLDDIAAVGDDLHRFIAKAEKPFGIFEQDFTGGSEFYGLGGAVKKFGPVGLFELANLGADGGLCAENFLAGA